MTVASTAVETDWVLTDGTNKNWSYNFSIYNEADVVVQIADTELLKNTPTEYTTGFTLVPANAAKSSGYVTYPSSGAAVAAGKYIRIVRRLALTQSADIGSEGDFSPAIHERAFDRATMKIQQLANSISKLPLIGSVGLAALSADVLNLLNTGTAQGDVINVVTLGAVADYNPSNPTASTDNTAVFQTAFNMAVLSKGTVYVPGGSYYFAQASASLDPGIGGFSIVGEYGRSILYFHEGTGTDGGATEKHLIKNTLIDPNKLFLRFHCLEFRGTFGQVGRTTMQGGCSAFLDHYKELHFSYCRWEKCTRGGIDTHFTGHFTADHCRLVDLTGDGLRQRESFYGQISNCYFQRIGDDSISWHGGFYHPTYDPDDGTPRREGLVVIGNTFRDTMACITALGARQLIVANNNANRFQNYFVYVDTTPSGFNEGNHPGGDIKIVNNTARNVITNSGGYVLIFTDAPRGSVANGNIIPGQPKATGVFEYIWDYLDVDVADANDAFPPLENIEISGNTFVCSLPLVANYTNWGFGYPAGTSYQTDLAITEDLLRPPVGVSVHCGKTTRIEGNTIKHTDDAVFLIAPTGVAPALDSTIVATNVLSDFINAGVRLNSVTGKLVDLSILGNNIQGDVFRKSPNSGLDGTYTNGFGYPRAIELGTSYGAHIDGNRIANVAQITDGNMDQHIWGTNTLICDPTALGTNAANKGIRNVLEPEWGFVYVIAYCDPQNALYGTIKNVTRKASVNLPASGFYPKGFEVKKIGPGVTDAGTSDYIVTGWKRLTTGSAHVLNTDWAEIRTLTGT